MSAGAAPSVTAEPPSVTAEPVAATAEPVTATAEPLTATADEVQAAWTDPKLANVLYHDWEAATYDAKWAISFDQRCIDYARDRFVHVAGEHGWPYSRSLEIGCGTGFFTLNLKLAGVLGDAEVTDLSPRMVQAARLVPGAGDVEGHAVLEDDPLPVLGPHLGHGLVVHRLERGAAG